MEGSTGQESRRDEGSLRGACRGGGEEGGGAELNPGEMARCGGFIGGGKGGSQGRGGKGQGSTLYLAHTCPGNQPVD